MWETCFEISSKYGDIRATSGGNYDVNFNGAIFVVRDSDRVWNILIFRNISCGNRQRKSVSMLIKTMENNEEILQALHGKFQWEIGWITGNEIGFSQCTIFDIRGSFDDLSGRVRERNKCWESPYTRIRGHALVHRQDRESLVSVHLSNNSVANVMSFLRC